jgi:hypothetical protein
MRRLTMDSDKGGLAFTFDLDITCEKSEIEKIVKLGQSLKIYEDMQEKVEERIEELKKSSDYPHNFKGQMVEDFEWVLGMLNPLN